MGEGEREREKLLLSLYEKYLFLLYPHTTRYVIINHIKRSKYFLYIPTKACYIFTNAVIYGPHKENKRKEKLRNIFTLTLIILG